MVGTGPDRQRNGCIVHSTEHGASCSVSDSFVTGKEGKALLSCGRNGTIFVLIPFVEMSRDPVHK